jgi:inosine/xanthosine triphosphate pyrophosphatase family protein
MLGNNFPALICKVLMFLMVIVCSKGFMESCGNEGLWKMIKSSKDKSAYAQCLFALKGPDSDPLIFTGKS